MKKWIKKLLILVVCICLCGCGKEITESEKHVHILEEQKNTADLITESIEIESEVRIDEATENLLESEEKAERIICWGDSLTYGQGGNGVTYPKVLQEKAELEVVNYGIQGETARQIAIRMGVLEMTTGAFEIPKDSTAVEVTLWQGGEDPIMMRLGDCGINPCVINGVEGTLSYKAEDNKYYFSRANSGAVVSVEENTRVETYASLNKKSSDIIVLFAGTNLPPDKNTVGELIEMEKRMLAYLETDRYVVVGLTSKKLIPDVDEINVALADAFGEHFIDIRSYLLENGLKDAGIEPTKKDKKNLKKGIIPSSLRVDEVHGNEAFYRIIGEQVYNKIEELGYIIQTDKNE